MRRPRLKALLIDLVVAAAAFLAEAL